MSENNDSKKRILNQSEYTDPNKKARIETLKYIPMKNGSVNANNSFKAPFSKNLSGNPKKIESIQEEIKKLESEIQELSQEGFKLEDLDEIIEKLHVYNDIKDITQTLLERMAHVKGETIKKMHEFYGLDAEKD